MSGETHLEARNGRVVEWHVTRCACGVLTLKLDTTSIELSPEQFAQLHRLVTQAMEEFEIRKSETEPVRVLH